MALEKLLPSNLIIPAESFSADRLAKNAQDLGYAQAETLEALIWDYELYAQLQKRISGLCRLKGGAAVQLYVPIERQRASVDVDILTTITMQSPLTFNSNPLFRMNRPRLKRFTPTQHWLPLHWDRNGN
jgi:hypothetical protein